MKRKLIEVALPLEAINRASAREKSIRHGHPSTLHLWWARRPLAACRAMLFAQLVDDPSAHPEIFPSEEDQALERKRLFDLIERLVIWENSTNEDLLREAREEIAKCFDGNLPTILDPFAGGGSIPLEAQRLGLEAHASDLNPVAVLINKALIEIPPRWAGRPPVFPGAAQERTGDATTWPRATGLAQDVRRYGEWMRDEAERRVGHLYPKVALADGGEATVIAWIWARSVSCPNPACRAKAPLVNSFTLSKRRGDATHVLPVVRGSEIEFTIEHEAQPSTPATVGRTGATCVACGTGMPLAYVRSEGKAGRLGVQLLATVAEGPRGRLYLAPDSASEKAADIEELSDRLDIELPEAALGFRVQAYGFSTQRDFYTARQLTLLGVLADLVGDARDRCAADSGNAAYANDVAVYLALLVGRVANRSSSQSFWNPGRDTVEQVFARNAVPMIWVYAEANPFSSSSGNIIGQLGYLAKAMEHLPARGSAVAKQADASTLSIPLGTVVVTDPPYYDNVPYADMADFFYVWHREALRTIVPDLYTTVVTPKASELIADRHRAGSWPAATDHFESGLAATFRRIVEAHPSEVPFSIFYAFKQAETDDQGTASTGWETMLSALIDAGAAVVATWPVRTELSGGLREVGRNALASSIVIVCRPRAATAEATTRRGFIQALHHELPQALRELQQGSIAPVDLAQATIGPGMAVYTRYRTVVEADGSAMTVRTALALINQVLDEVLAEQEGDFDADTRFCVKWFSQYGWDEAASGTADTLSRATNTSVAGLERGGIFRARAGRARLLAPDDLSTDWDPLADDRVSVWEVALRLAHALSNGGVEAAARLMAGARQRIDLDTAKELAYLLYAVCEKRGWTQSALLFNGLGTSWHDLASAERTVGPATAQSTLDFDDAEG